MTHFTDEALLSAEDLESLESCGLTVAECLEESEQMSRAERANEYALEGVTNYEEGSYLEQAREEACFWVSASEMMDANPRF